MKSIEINQVFGQIGINIQKPDLKLNIKAPEADIKITPPNLDLQIDNPEIFIDLRQSFNSVGYKDVQTFTDEFIADAKQTAEAGVERVVSEGDATSKAKGPSIGELAFQDSLPREKEVEIGLIPSVPPKVTAQMGRVKGIYTPGRVKVGLIPGALNGDFTWGKVDVYMEREAHIDIKA